MTQSTQTRGALAVLLLTVFVDMVGFGIVIPFLPFWAEHFDATPDLVAFLMAVYAAFQFVFAFLWGWISDRWGRKPVLLMSLMGSVFSFIWLGLAETLWMLFAARALAGAMSANISVAHAYIADVTRPEERARAMGLLGAAFGLGFVFGPALGGLLAGPDPANPDFRTPFFVAASVSFAGVLLGLVFLREPTRHAPPDLPRGVVARFRAFARVMADPGVAYPVLIISLLAFVMGGVESTFAMWTERALGWGPRENGWFFTYIGVCLVLVQGVLVGRLVRIRGEVATALIGIVAMAAGIGMVPAVDSVALILVSGGLIALGIGLGNPSMNGLISRSAPAYNQGAVMGASQSSQALARIFGPAIAGVLFAAFGRDMPYFFGAAVLVIAFALALRVMRLTRPPRTAEK